MLLKVLATGHSTDIYFIQCTSPFNYIPVGGGIPPWEVEVFDGLWKLVSLYTNHAFPPQSIIFRKPKITDTFRDPILVTETNWHITPWTLQVLSSWTILELVAALMSVRALAQAEVLTNHKKVTTIVITKSVMVSFRLSRYRFVKPTYSRRAAMQYRKTKTAQVT